MGNLSVAQSKDTGIQISSFSKLFHEALEFLLKEKERIKSCIKVSMYFFSFFFNYEFSIEPMIHLSRLVSMKLDKKVENSSKLAYIIQKLTTSDQVTFGSVSVNKAVVMSLGKLSIYPGHFRIWSRCAPY